MYTGRNRFHWSGASGEMPLATVKVYHAAAIVTPALTFETKPYVKKASKPIRLSESLSNFHHFVSHARARCTAPAVEAGSSAGSSLSTTASARKTGRPRETARLRATGCAASRGPAWRAADECSARTTASNFSILSTARSAGEIGVCGCACEVEL